MGAQRTWPEANQLSVIREEGVSVLRWAVFREEEEVGEAFGELSRADAHAA